MTYQTPESKIRQIMSESSAAAHMAPALKTDDSARLSAAASVLKASGVGSAEVKNNSISVSAGEMNQAANILDAAFQHGMITVKPSLVSAEAIDMPEPHVPAPTMAKEETVEEAKAEELEINQGSVDADGKVKLEPRSLNNRMQNQIKKVDEEVEQLDEISKKTLGRYVKAAAGSIEDHGRESTARNFRGNAALKAGQGARMDAHDKARDGHEHKLAQRHLGVSRAVKRLTKEETELNELSYSTLKSYEGKAKDQTSHDKLTRKIARRKNYIATAKMKKQEKVSKAAFGDKTVKEESNPLVMLERVRMLAEGKGRLTATFHSECGKHSAKCYHDREWGEHRVEYHINGKHHEPADSHHSDKEDAHGTAKAELSRMSKLNGALKEANEAGEDLSWIEEEFEQLDEISKKTLASYRGKAGFSASKALHHAEHGMKHGSEEGKAAAEGHFKTVEKRRKGIAMARQQMLNKVTQKEEAEGNVPFLGEAIKQLDELEQIGAYTNKVGHTLKVHRNPNDKKHLFVTHGGKVVDYHHGAPKELHKKLTKDGLTGSMQEEVEQIDEISKETLKSYISKAHKDKRPAKADPSDPKQLKNALHNLKRIGGINAAEKKLAEEVELTEAKADVEKATKHLMKHPEADAIGRSIMTATKQFNYVQDAVDHVYNNHSKDVSYEDHHKMRPHLEDHFKKAGLKK